MATNRRRTVAYLEVKDREALEVISQHTGATLSKLVERAVRLLLKKEK